ncbi:aminotransferase [Xylella fastidiosa]|uniref:pyridoxal phosphate-dependent aminotransferase n=1 Tax=Xylella fastidiosa TaxID=2371 RepID=UPI00090C8601|nr:pyridoxal phosphate-dependent aminotransferase [Xylella fastidiosa]ALQ95510.1 aminotransferase [Xylella fastidiosa]
MQVTSKLPGVGTTIFSVMSQLADAYGAVNLGQGFPDFPVPLRLQEALESAVREGHNQYPPMIGVAGLRQGIAAKVLRCYGAQVDADVEITVTSGATEAIFNAIHAVVGAGDEVIVLDPAYDCYEPGIVLAGARAVHVPLDAVSFTVDWDRVGAAITSRTRLLIVNSPHNPSGALFSADDMRALAALLDGTDILLISDEVYEHIVFDGCGHESVLRWPQLRARAFVISSFGKTYHCTGWKIGYVIAPLALSAEFRKVHQYNTFTSFGPAQYAFAAMLREEPEYVEQVGLFYQARRDCFREQLLTTKLVPLPVSGGYFQLVDYGAVSDLSDVEFSRWLAVEKGVVSIPLSPFYETAPAGQRLVRLCFAKNDMTLGVAIERLQGL